MNPLQSDYFLSGPCRFCMFERYVMRKMMKECVGTIVTSGISVMATTAANGCGSSPSSSSAASALLPNFRGDALTFEVEAQCSVSKARVARLSLPHSVIETPVFMPVGTSATLKVIINDAFDQFLNILNVVF